MPALVPTRRFGVNVDACEEKKRKKEQKARAKRPGFVPQLKKQDGLKEAQREFKRICGGGRSRVVGWGYGQGIDGDLSHAKENRWIKGEGDFSLERSPERDAKRWKKGQRRGG